MKKNIILIITLVFLIIALSGIWFWRSGFKKTDSSLSDVKKRGVLVVGSDIPYGVMEFFDQNNKPVGIDVDVAKEIASHLGVKLEFNDYDWEQIFPLVKNGKIDLAMSSVTITPDRQKEMLFSQPYFNGGQVIVVLSKNQEIKGVNSLSGKKIAVQKDTTSYTEAKKYTSENLISSYLDFDGSGGAPNIVDDLKNEKVDAIIVDYTQALNIIKNNTSLKIVGVPFTKEDYGVVTKIGNNSLIEKVNLILQQLKDDGTMDQIETKWEKI